MSEDRFKTIEKKVDKVEDKLDRITEILATQAEHNQRLVNLAEREQRSEERLDQLEKDVTTITKNVQQNATAASIGVWLINTVVSVVIGIVVGLVIANYQAGS